MKILRYSFKAIFVEAAHRAFPDLSMDELLDLISIEDPKNSAHGDLASPAPLRIGKLKGMNPQEVGERILEHFPEDFRVGKIYFAAPGFLNIGISNTYLAECLKELEHGFFVERDFESTGPVILDFPSTNAAKHMGVHHLITTVLGDSLANLFEFMGQETIRINHFGDWGTNFGMLIYAFEKWGDKLKVHADPNNELSKLYVLFNEEAEKNPDLLEEARAVFKSLETGDPERIKLWKWMLQESLTDLEKLLSRMNVAVDHHLGESFFLKKAEDVIQDGLKSGVFTDGRDGALIYENEELQSPALVRKNDGTTLYLTRDVATIKYRVETWHPANILYIVDHAQSLHFKQNFAIAKALNYCGDSALEHISFGRMNFVDKAMSSRKGNIIKLAELLDEAKNRAAKLTKKGRGNFEESELDKLCENIGISSIKYVILSQDRVKDIIFDWDRMISLDGNSAPYLLYSYARAKSILSKAGDFTLDGLPEFTDEHEITLMRRMMKFPQTLEYAMMERKPHHIATFLYELCGEFNRFYVHCPVNTENADPKIKRSRLGLIQAFMHQLKSGLGILGISVVEKM